MVSHLLKLFLELSVEQVLLLGVVVCESDLISNITTIIFLIPKLSINTLKYKEKLKKLLIQSWFDIRKLKTWRA
jgi:hypothetical protein